MSDRNIYLKTVASSEAVEAAKAALDRDALIKKETVPSHQALGRVTAGAIHARCSSPTFHSSAMDGIAVRAEDTFGAREGQPIKLVRGRDFEPVNTGNPLPEGRDAVIMIENVVYSGEDAFIETPAFPWQHVRRIGEDIVATELIFPRNHTITAYDVGALLAAGIWEVEVWERVRAVFIPTGDEVLNYTERPTPEPGQVIESNSQVFSSLVRGWGIEARCVPCVPDDPQSLGAAVDEALESDAHVVIVGAGSSAGSKDFTRGIFETVGRVLAHGIKTMPGKPTVVGEARGKLLLGAPGYPVSAVVCFEDVLAPVAAWLTRVCQPQRQAVAVNMARSTPSKLGMEEHMRLAVGRVGAGYCAVPLERGAGMITSLTRAQAVTRIPPESEGVPANKTVMAELLVPMAELNRVLVHVGSHDNTLDLLSDELMGLDTPYRLASSHVGSMGGLSALRNHSALFAGAHLLDPDSGDFNFPFLEKHLAGVDVKVVNLAIRHQGLIVAPGNPRGISGLEDLAEKDAVFINRQRGSGTRILLDYELKKAGLKPSDITGYKREEYTHMTVAVNVLTGAADCGLGIMAAARALGLDFVPLARERYDLLIPVAHLDDPKIKTLLQTIRTDDFQKKIEDMGGYETSLTGQTMDPGMGLG